MVIQPITAQKSPSKKKKNQTTQIVREVIDTAKIIKPQYDKFRIKFVLYVKVNGSHNPISNCTVTLTGSDSSIIVKSTDSTGKVVFDKEGEKYAINPNVNYLATITKVPFLTETKRFSTVGGGMGKDFVEEVFLTYKVNEVMDLPEIQYAYDKWELLVQEGRINSYDSLDFLYQLMIENPTIIVEIQNHTDCRGKPHYSTSLSQRRAQSCVEYLVSKGISKDRLIAKGFRSEVPRGPGLDCESIKKLPTKEEQEKAHQLNRRTQFMILSFEYKPIDK